MTFSKPHLQLSTAFVLGAGQGKRLYPRTADWPKPLLSLGGRPAITYAFDQLKAAGIKRFIINTHHCAERYHELFPDGYYQGIPLTFRYEPVLLETGGGIKNIEDLVGEEPLLIYNGDILSTLPLQALIQHHFSQKNEVTLALRSYGGPQQVRLGDNGLVQDIGHRLTSKVSESYLFAGVYLINQTFFQRLTPGKKESVILPFIEMIREGARLGGVVLDEGEWSDIGTPESFDKMNEKLTQQKTEESFSPVGFNQGKEK